MGGATVTMNLTVLLPYVPMIAMIMVIAPHQGFANVMMTGQDWNVSLPVVTAIARVMAHAFLQRTVNAILAGRAMHVT